MNERIKELMEQAGLYDFVIESMGINEEMEKFAELIVKETLQVARAGIEFGDGMEDAVYTYFGVESTSIKVGSRVKVVSGFNVGAKGTVSYIEPTGRMWVMRDGASTDVFYHPEEVIGVEE